MWLEKNQISGNLDLVDLPINLIDTASVLVLLQILYLIDVSIFWKHVGDQEFFAVTFGKYNLSQIVFYFLSWVEAAKFK